MASPQRSPSDSSNNKRLPRHLSPARPSSMPAARSENKAGRTELPRSGVTRSPKQNAATRGWVVIETLTGNRDEATLVLNHEGPRAFSKLARASLPRNLVEVLVRECLDNGGNNYKGSIDNQDRMFRISAIPVRGPASDDIFAVSLFSAGPLEPLPKPPVVGTVEWTPSGLLITNPAAEYLLRPPNELPGGRTIPELLASFDRWEPRAEFLDMFNFVGTPASQWVGTAAKRYEDGTQHQFHITARAVGAGDKRRVRAVVCDISATSTSHDTDIAVAALRAVPIFPGHALALVDLKSAFVHEWLAEEHSPLAGWRHHHPLYDLDGRNRVALTCQELASGTRDRALITARVRFTATDDWTEVTGAWTRIPSADGRPQAILDITPNPNPPPPIKGCDVCYDITHP